VSGELTLAATRLGIAREYGFASWTRLKTEVQARTSGRAEQVESFVQASVRDWTGRAARMLLATPKIAEYGFATAVVLCDVARVRVAIERDPRLVNRSDPRSGWTPLRLVCASRWHRLDPARTSDLVAVARVLLDAGAGPAAQAGEAGRRFAARSPASPIRRLSGCYWTAVRDPTTTTCTWPASATTPMRACDCSSTSRRVSPKAPRCQLRSAPATSRGYACPCRPAPTPTDCRRPSSTAHSMPMIRPGQPRTPLSDPAAPSS